MNARRRRRTTQLATVILACTGVTAGCAHDPGAGEEALEFPQQIVTPLCVDAHPPITVELVRVSKDWRPRKPSANLEHYLIDLHIVRNDSIWMDLWLLVDEETFPSAVSWLDVHAEPSRARDAREPWCFAGNDIAHARSLGGEKDVWLRNIEVSTGTPRISVSLGSISIDGASPQQWLRRTGGNHRATADEPRAQAHLELHCTSWFDVMAEAERPSDEPRVGVTPTPVRR